MTLTVTPFFVGLLALAQIPLTIMVGYYRLKTDIHFLDGNDGVLLRRMRAHGNFTETVPIALIAMAAAELTGLSAWALWAGGAVLVTGRTLHTTQMLINGWGPGRSIGMGLTFLAIAGFGLWCLTRTFA